MNSDSDEWEEVHEGSSDFSEPYLCLVCQTTLTSIPEFINHLVSEHDWNHVDNNRKKILLSDQYNWIRFVNLMRKGPFSNLSEALLNPSWQGDSMELLQPVLSNDGVLTIDVESLREANSNNQPSETEANSIHVSPSGDSNSEEIAKLMEDNKILREQLITCKRLLNSLVNQPAPTQKQSLFSARSVLPERREPDGNESDDSEDSDYFMSYGHFSIHSEMINDRIRTESYRDFILGNADHYFKDKVILDVGSGTGILSLFAAQAGAKHVYGIEASVDIFATAEETLSVNQMKDRVTFIRDRAESVNLPVKKVDVIISEWMGYFLLFESMLDSVLNIARRYLDPNGHIFPRHYDLYLMGVECSSKLRQTRLEHWANVYGFQMPALRRAALSEAHILDLTVQSRIGSVNDQLPVRILTPQPAQLIHLDLMELYRTKSCDTSQSYMGRKPFKFIIESNHSPIQMDALIGYFDVEFERDAPVKVNFSTSPLKTYTHWKQTLFFLDKPITVQQGDMITGHLTIRCAPTDERGLEINLHLIAPRLDNPITQTYMLLEPDFNHIHWINEALKSSVTDHNVDQRASDLVLQLQSRMKEVMQTLDHACQESILSVPRFLREVEVLKSDAIALNSDLQKLQQNITQVDNDSQTVIENLTQLDCTRRNAQAAANALREANQWTSLIQSMDELFESGDLDQLCCNIESLEQSLLSLTHLADYTDRVKLVETHKNSLESLLAPQLIQALDSNAPLNCPNLDLMNKDALLIPESTSAGEAAHLISLLHRIGRSDAACKYYTNWIKTNITDLWNYSQSKCEIIIPKLERIVYQLVSSPPTSLPSLSSLTNQNVTIHDQTLVEQKLTSFYALLLCLFKLQLNAKPFPEDFLTIFVQSISDALENLSPFQKIDSEKLEFSVTSRLFQITLNCCSMGMDLFESDNSGTQQPNPPTPTRLNSCSDSVDKLNLHRSNPYTPICQALVRPFSFLVQSFDLEWRTKFEKQSASIELVNAHFPQSDFPIKNNQSFSYDWQLSVGEGSSALVNKLKLALINSFKLFDQVVKSCFDQTYGLGIPFLLDIIHLYWDSLIAKWLIAVNRIGDQLVAMDYESGYDQASGFALALQVANLTGELSVRADEFVEQLLSRSADWTLNIFEAAQPSISSPISKKGIHIPWNILYLFVNCQSPDYQNTMRALAYPSIVLDHHPRPQNQTDTIKSNEKTGLRMRSNLLGMHRSGAMACRSTVTVVRQVALAPMHQLLKSFASLNVWYLHPASGETSLPDFAYLPQDYITKIGQYLFTLPTSLEPYMGTDLSGQLSPGPNATATSEISSNRGLAQCLYLGDPESTFIMSTTSSQRTTVEQSDPSSGGTRRTRQHSSSLAGSRRSQTDLGPNSPESSTFCWLENLIAGAACDLLVSTVIQLSNGSSNDHHQTKQKSKQQQSKTLDTKSKSSSSGAVSTGHDSDSESSTDDSPLLTEHGLKQLNVDLGYFLNTLEDLGLTVPGTLQTLKDLISCPAEQFPMLSADRAPRIVNAVAHLRGL